VFVDSEMFDIVILRNILCGFIFFVILVKQQSLKSKLRLEAKEQSGILTYPWNKVTQYSIYKKWKQVEKFTFFSNSQRLKIGEVWRPDSGNFHTRVF
jgi:hypothetical protein